jgi:tetratricopeptide (TPR) repeat protein
VRLAIIEPKSEPEASRRDAAPAAGARASRTKQPMRLAILLTALVLAVGACAETGGGRPARPQLSEAVMVGLAQAKNYHHQADVYLADGDTDAAIKAVTAILSVPFPAGSPEGEDTVLDARARLAKLYLNAGRAAEARRIVDEGLNTPTARESFFLANLHTVSGELHEQAAQALTGDQAKQARRDAIMAYDRSIEINKRIQKQLLEEGVSP